MLDPRKGELIMVAHDDHVKQVKRLTGVIRNSPDPDTRNKASDDLKVKWTTYKSERGKR